MDNVTLIPTGYNHSDINLIWERYMSDRKPEWITTKEAAEIMDVTQTTVGRLCNRGKLDCKRYGTGRGSVWMVRRESAESYERDYGGRPRKDD